MSRAFLPTLLTAVLLVGGCADAEPSATSADPTTTPSDTAPTVDPTPTGQATTEQPKSRPEKQRAGGKKIAPSSVPAARRDGTRQHLLTAARLPALDDVTWTVSGTAAEAPEPAGACQKTSLVDLGAVHAVRRDFAGPAGSGVAARQIVAKFADKTSAWRAEQVLRAWRDDCEQRLDYPRKAVGPLQEVETASGGVAGHYRLTYGSRRAVDATGTGIVRSGPWLTIVEITADRDDYPTQWNPVRRAVRRIAATFA